MVLAVLAVSGCRWCCFMMPSAAMVLPWCCHGASGVSGERLPPMGDMGSLLPAHLHIYIYGIDFIHFAWISSYNWLNLLAKIQPTNSFHYGSNS